ncbi:PREDICTED: translation initiation factor IF-2-like isoform X2 [Ficedula albicollis]|uniref:translation initiation factor IF-2-like isoform X1 n=1 Tax=Ficedula albicollis TaxID=59894 RepID=UPI000359D038|nr:PREDICTED: translation initiation factor IF-2-like isoform X1 [Ficedula albicollis]XP_005058578.1 PREDICTED: translation initiation factor IF-2-like isoform X2 [Ficedula albicollis]
MKRETPRFSPSALKPAPPPALLSGLRPPRPAAGQSDGRTDGRSAQAGRAGGALGVSAGRPLPAPCRAPSAVWGFFVSRAGRTPRVLRRRDPSGLRQRHRRASETPPAPGECQRCPHPARLPGGCAGGSVPCWGLCPTCTPLGVPHPARALSSCPGCCPTQHQPGDPGGSKVWGWLERGLGAQDPGCARAEGVWGAPDPRGGSRSRDPRISGCRIRTSRTPDCWVWVGRTPDPRNMGATLGGTGPQTPGGI